MAHNIALKKSDAIPQIEAELHKLSDHSVPKFDVNLSVAIALPSASQTILSDVWFGILAGTAAGEFPTDIVARGLSEIEADSQFAASFPALSILRSAQSIRAEANSNQTDQMELIKSLLKADGGLVAGHSASQGHTLLEIDPEFSVAEILRDASLRSGDPLRRRQLFTQMILRLRKAAEIGALRAGVAPGSEGPAGSVGKFLFEIHENALEHGSRDPSGHQVPGSRLLRIRKHLANSPEQLVARADGFPELQRYIEKTKFTAYVEASISDFGFGIVDGFLNSQVGQSFASVERARLLDRLLFRRLSSKGRDPGAGLGIQRALRAARQMNAFVSLRTGEFWLAGGPSQEARSVELRDVSLGDQCSWVRGTHWQFFWPQPVLQP